MEQITIEEYLEKRKKSNIGGCDGCVCKNCLYWWSDRCPYGKCYDDHRAEQEPYDKAHPNKTSRKGWSKWDRPEEQAHWCRGGIFYPQYYCSHFIKYQGQQVRECLDAVVAVFQDGYISCSLVDVAGCEECYRRFNEHLAEERINGREKRKSD